MKILNTNTHKYVEIDPLMMKTAMRKPLPLRVMRIDFPFVLNREPGGAGDFIVIDESGNEVICGSEDFIMNYEDTDFMTPDFREFSKGGFSDLCLYRGAKPTDVGNTLGVIDDVSIITNGRQPVYVISIVPDATEDEVRTLSNILIDVHIAAVVIPSNFVTIEGVMEKTDPPNIFNGME
jgi:hypothetical protein